MLEIQKESTFIHTEVVMVFVFMVVRALIIFMEALEMTGCIAMQMIH